MTTIRIRFTASTGGVVLDGVKHFGAPAELAKGDFQRREPCAFAAAQEFLRQGTTAGTVVITAT